MKRKNEKLKEAVITSPTPTSILDSMNIARTSLFIPSRKLKVKSCRTSGKDTIPNFKKSG